MAHSVKIRTLTAPHSALANFDPAEYLETLEFYETADPLGETDRDGLAQFAHFLAFLALKTRSPRFSCSIVRRGTSAYRAVESHFHHLEGWAAISANSQGVSYRALVSLLMPVYPPHLPK
jgi:hypothetical protein